MKKRIVLPLLLAAVGISLTAQSPGQVIIYDEDWNTDQAVSAYTDWSSGVVNLGAGATNPGPTASSSIASMTNPSGSDGLAYSSYDTGNFVLSDADVTWTATAMENVGFNTSRDWQDGLSGGPEAGALFWLAGTDSDFSAGDGYFASSVGNNNIGLYRYTGGVDGTITKFLTGTYSAGTGNAYDMEIRYTAATDTWEILAADTGNTLISQGTMIDATYTGSTMVTSGIGFNGFAGAGASGRGGQVDAVSMSVVPEPNVGALIQGSILFLLLMRRRRR